MPTTLSSLSGNLRSALAGEQCARAQATAAEYARSLVAQWQALPPGDPEVPRLWREARELWEWARCVALAQKAHLEGQLKTTAPVLSYIEGQTSERRTFDLSG
jgi:hypothetical protein